MGIEKWYSRDGDPRRARPLAPLDRDCGQCDLRRVNFVMRFGQRLSETLCDGQKLNASDEKEKVRFEPSSHAGLQRSGSDHVTTRA
jgi:hypothetical protein